MSVCVLGVHTYLRNCTMHTYPCSTYLMGLCSYNGKRGVPFNSFFGKLKLIVCVHIITFHLSVCVCLLCQVASNPPGDALSKGERQKALSELSQLPELPQSDSESPHPLCVRTCITPHPLHLSPFLSLPPFPLPILSPSPPFPLLSSLRPTATRPASSV